MRYEADRVARSKGAARRASLGTSSRVTLDPSGAARRRAPAGPAGGPGAKPRLRPRAPLALHLGRWFHDWARAPARTSPPTGALPLCSAARACRSPRCAIPRARESFACSRGWEDHAARRRARTAGSTKLRQPRRSQLAPHDCDDFRPPYAVVPERNREPPLPMKAVQPPFLVAVKARAGLLLQNRVVPEHGRVAIGMEATHPGA